MSRLICIVFVSFQITSLLGSPVSNGSLGRDSRASSPEKIFHAEIFPARRPQKCCSPATQIYSIDKGGCSRLSGNGSRFSADQVSMYLPFLNLTTTIGCAVSVILNELQEQNYTLLGNGMLYEHLRNKTHDHDHFCFDYILEYERFVPIICVDISEIEEYDESTNSEVETSATSDKWLSNHPKTPTSKSEQSYYSEVQTTATSDELPSNNLKITTSKLEQSSHSSEDQTATSDELPSNNLKITTSKFEQSSHFSEGQTSATSDKLPSNDLAKSKYEQSNYYTKDQKSSFWNRWQPNDHKTLKSKYFQKQYLYVLGLSNFFLMITLCVYLILPELHYNQFDWSLMCHIACLIIGFCCLIADSKVSNNNAACIPLAYMRQFWILSSFCWLNVMGIYLWRSMFPQKLNGTFHIVCLCAFGFPAFVFVITFLATNLNIFDKFTKPGFEKTCWFQDHNGEFWFNPKFIYFYNTILMTIILNLGLFVRIVFKILFQNPGWKPTVFQDEQEYDLLYMRFFLCLKLFFVMGLSWIADMVSFLVAEEELKWRLKNLAVLLHGFFIFVSFVGNERVITLLLKRFSIGNRFKTLYVEQKIIFISDNPTERLIIR